MYRLLVAEDEPIVRNGICQLVDYSQFGIHDVYQASDGEKAWQLIQQYEPNIVLSDINMPKLDGIQLAQLIKTHYPHTHIVFLTGYDYFDYAVSALKIGVDDYLLKPFSKQDIEALLTRLLKKLSQEQKQRVVQDWLEKQQTKQPDLAFEIQNRLFDPSLSLKQLAVELGFNANYLGTLIKKELGIPFQDYVSQQRIAQAKLLLLTTPLKVYEIATKVGFDDVNYFSLRFRQIVGMTPRQFQKEGRHD